MICAHMRMRERSCGGRRRQSGSLIEGLRSGSSIRITRAGTPADTERDGQFAVHDGIRSDDGTIADARAAQDRGFGADPHVGPDYD